MIGQECRIPAQTPFVNTNSQHGNGRMWEYGVVREVREPFLKNRKLNKKKTGMGPDCSSPSHSKSTSTAGPNNGEAQGYTTNTGWKRASLDRPNVSAEDR